MTLQCTKDAQMIVVVARDATLPNLDLETISFLGNDPRCSPVGVTSAFAIYQFPLTDCGTTLLVSRTTHLTLPVDLTAYSVVIATVDEILQIHYRKSLVL